MLTSCIHRRSGSMSCILPRPRVMPAIAAVVLMSTCAAASAQGFLDGIFGSSDRFSAPGQAEPSRAVPQDQSRAQAAPQQGRVAQAPGDLTTRIDRLEAVIRELTGAIEQLQHRNQLLEGQVRRMQGEPDAPRGPAPGRSSVAPHVPPAAPLAQTGRRGDAFDPTQNPNAPGAPRVLGSIPGPSSGSSPGTSPGAPPPGSAAAGQDFEPDDSIGAPGGRDAGAPLDLSTLAGPVVGDRPRPQAAAPVQGELPAPPPRTPSGTGAQVATLPPSDSPRDSYDLAYGYIQRKDYALAEEGFRSFVRRFPSDRLAPEAHYWLGESMFQRQRYRDAAEAFLNVSTKFESSPKAPDALFRLGQSLAALGEKEAACASLGEIARKFPRATATLKQSVEREQKRVRC